LFNLVDKKTIFNQKIEPNISDYKSSVKIEQYKSEKHEFEQLKSLAFQSGIYSRFFKDKQFIDNEFQRLYTRWIEMSVNDSKNYTVLIAFYNEKVAGFITLKYISNKKSEIGLIAVSQDYRGLGIGKSLINEAIQKSIENGIEEINITTQLDNQIAVNLYKSTNFNIQEITYIYHWWNSN
jgi:dTDP-4-amino-4,6-dideoxy-D-galactose acyltransferase